MPILVRASAEIEASITTAIELKMKKSTSYGGGAAAVTFPRTRVKFSRTKLSYIFQF